MIGLVAFSFALRNEDQEPNPCNQKLGNITYRLAQKEHCEVIIVAQWEIAKQRKKLGMNPKMIVKPNENGEYLDSQDVWDCAKNVFRSLGITRVIPVAQSFLHLHFIKQMIKKDGFTVENRPIEKIGFDPSTNNTQPWTKSAFALLLYAIKIKLGFKHGSNK